MYILYHPINSTTLNNIIDYLNYLGYNLNPQKYVEHKTLVIETEYGKVYIGEKECIQFFTDKTLIIHLKDKANEYCISRKNK